MKEFRWGDSFSVIRYMAQKIDSKRYNLTTFKFNLSTFWNVGNKELTHCNIPRSLRTKMNLLIKIDTRENLNNYIQFQTIRKLPLFNWHLTCRLLSGMLGTENLLYYATTFTRVCGTRRNPFIEGFYLIWNLISYI